MTNEYGNFICIYSPATYGVPSPTKRVVIEPSYVLPFPVYGDVDAVQ